MRRLLLLLLALSWPAGASAQETIPVLFGGYAFDQAARHQIAADLWLLRTNTRYFVRAVVPFVGVSPQGITKVGGGFAMVGGDDVGGWVFVDARGYGYAGRARGGGADAGFGVCLDRLLFRGAYGWAAINQRRGWNGSVSVLARLATF